MLCHATGKEAQAYIITIALFMSPEHNWYPPLWFQYLKNPCYQSYCSWAKCHLVGASADHLVWLEVINKVWTSTFVEDADLGKEQLSRRPQFFGVYLLWQEQFFISNSHTAPQFECSTDGTSRIFLPPYAVAWIQTLLSRVAPWPWTFWRTLYQLSFGEGVHKNSNACRHLLQGHSSSYKL